MKNLSRLYTVLQLYNETEVIELTHWHTQTSLRRPGSLGPLIHGCETQFRDQPNITAQQY